MSARSAPRLVVVPRTLLTEARPLRSDPGSWLARHAVAEVDDSRAEGAGPDEFEIHAALALGEERNTTAANVALKCSMTVQTATSSRQASSRAARHRVPRTKA
jgi:hypothetical protein